MCITPNAKSRRHFPRWRKRRRARSFAKRARSVTCEAINGLIEECEELLDEAKQPSAVRDAGLIACGQAVEHYEMARYGALIAWAKAAGHTEVIKLLQETLD